MAKIGFKKSSSAVWPWLALALLLLIADQFTKVLILGYYQLGDATYVTGFFNIVRVHNSGAAFSFFSPAFAALASFARAFAAAFRAGTVWPGGSRRLPQSSPGCLACG
jgi:signal peptidase II